MISTKVKMAIGAIAIASILGGLYTGFLYIKSLGYNEAQIECNEKFARYEERVDKRVATLEESVRTLGTDLVSKNDTLTADIGVILERTKRTPIVTIKNGKCVPSQTFIDGVNQAIDRVNAEGSKK